MVLDIPSTGSRLWYRLAYASGIARTRAGIKYISGNTPVNYRALKIITLLDGERLEHRNGETIILIIGVIAGRKGTGRK